MEWLKRMTKWQLNHWGPRAFSSLYTLSHFVSQLYLCTIWIVSFVVSQCIVHQVFFFSIKGYFFIEYSTAGLQVQELIKSGSELSAGPVLSVTEDSTSIESSRYWQEVPRPNIWKWNWRSAVKQQASRILLHKDMQCLLCNKMSIPACSLCPLAL